jgi:hypothetical protein
VLCKSAVRPPCKHESHKGDTPIRQFSPIIPGKMIIPGASTKRVFLAALPKMGEIQRLTVWKTSLSSHLTLNNFFRDFGT